MELPVASQALLLLRAAGLGLLFAFCYDLCRGLRRQFPRLTWALDLIFGLVFWYGLCRFTLIPGQGLFRAHLFWAVLAGSLCWFFLFSTGFLRLWTGLFRIISAGFRVLFRPVTNILKKLHIFAKKAFSSGKKWGRITCKMNRNAQVLHRGKGGNGHAL